MYKYTYYIYTLIYIYNYIVYICKYICIYYICLNIYIYICLFVIYLPSPWFHSYPIYLPGLPMSPSRSSLRHLGEWPGILPPHDPLHCVPTWCSALSTAWSLVVVQLVRMFFFIFEKEKGRETTIIWNTKYDFVVFLVAELVGNCVGNKLLIHVYAVMNHDRRTVDKQKSSTCQNHPSSSSWWWWPCTISSLPKELVEV